MTRVGVLGSGAVGETLANGFLKHGYEVMRASRDPGKLAAWKDAAGSKASTGSFADAAKFGDLVVLAVKGTGAIEAIDLAGVETLAGKTVIDATNPIAASPPTNGVIAFFTDGNESLMEKLQKRAPKANFVKAFSCVGNSLMVNPALSTKPSMFICGNNAAAKAATSKVLEQFGWEIEDMGAMEAARAIEPLCILWCVPGFLRNDWVHAFKMLRPG